MPGWRTWLCARYDFRKNYAEQVLWLLIDFEQPQGPQKHLAWAGAINIEVVNMAQGQKVSRFLAWSFMPQSERQARLEQLLC